MKNINLLPIRYKEKHTNRYIVWIAVSSQGIVILVCLFLIILTNSILHNRIVELNNINTLLQNIHIIEANTISNEIELIKANNNIIYDLLFNLNYTPSKTYFINTIFENLPAVNFQEIIYENRRIVINIFTYDINLIPIFIDDLNYTNLFRNIQILSTFNANNGTFFSIEIFFS